MLQVYPSDLKIINHVIDSKNSLEDGFYIECSRWKHTMFVPLKKPSALHILEHLTEQIQDYCREKQVQMEEILSQ